MGQRKAQPQSWHEEEAHYIQGAWPRDADKFSNDRATFERYVAMQAACAREDGFEDIAQSMEAAARS